MQRTVYEVTKMSSKVKAILNRQVTSNEESELEPVKVILLYENTDFRLYMLWIDIDFQTL